MGLGGVGRVGLGLHTRQQAASSQPATNQQARHPANQPGPCIQDPGQPSLDAGAWVQDSGSRIMSLGDT